MKLNQIKVIGKHRKWCGPAALSIITGRSVNFCAGLIAKARNRTGYRGYNWHNGKGSSRQVKGTYDHELKYALNKMGFKMTRIKIPMKHHKHQVYAVNQAAFVKPTLRAYMAERGGKEWKGTMLLEVTGHYVVARRDVISDNHAQDKHYTDHPMRRKIVKDGWLIERA